MTRRAEGFTLVEVLAALGVFSVAAMGLITLTSNSTRAASHLQNRFLAQIVAENTMVDAMTDPLPLRNEVKIGESEQRSRTFVWTRTVVDAGSGRLKLISVSVSDPATEQVLFELQALRMDP